MSDNALVFINAEGRPQYRASGIYNCLSVLVASRLGLEANSPPDWLMERFQQGHDFEGMVLERAKGRGYSRLDNFQMELRQDVGPAVLVGHIDALAHGTPVPDSINGVAGVLLPDDDEAITVLDAKAFAPSTYQSWDKKRFDAFPYYAWQLTVYKTALERELKRPVNIGMAVGLKNMEAANRGELKLDGFRLDLFTESPVPFGRVMARILEVEKIARSEGMDGIPAKCDQPNFPCPFFAYPFHSAKEADSTIDESAIEGGLGTIAVLADKRNEAYRAMKDAEKVVAECDEQMKAAVGDAIGSVKVAKMSAQVSSVTFYHSSYTTTNWDQVQTDYPGFDRSKYQDQRPSSKLSVRVNPKRTKKEEGGD